MAKVSVIIPIYGVEKYIERCVRHLFEQTLDDIEYIFVNDCTTDKSIDILKYVLKDYENRIPQTRIIHHDVNKGLPQARKTGFQYATGEYVIHCDSDDWPDLNLYESMYNKASVENLDVVVCDRIETDGITERRYKGLTSCDIEKCVWDMMYVKMGWQVWNKMIRREIYTSDIVFPTGGMGEDMVLMLQLFSKSKSIGYVDNYCYYYYINNESMVHLLTRKQCLRNYHQMIENVRLINNYYKRNGLFKYKKGLNHLLFKSKNLIFPLLTEKEYYCEYKNNYRRCDFMTIMDGRAPVKEKLIALLTQMGIFPLPRNKYSNILKNE